MQRATPLSTLLAHVRHTVQSSSFWLAAGITVHIAAYQYTLLAPYVITDLFWFRGCAVAYALYGIAFYCTRYGAPPRILTSIMAGLAVNCLMKDCFGKPNELNVYDYYGAAVTVLLIIYEQRKKAIDANGHRSSSNHGG